MDQHALRPYDQALSPKIQPAPASPSDERLLQFHGRLGLHVLHGRIDSLLGQGAVHGKGLAALLFSSDGILSEPVDLLGPVAEAVHEAGGLFIADEVQCGFARTGEAMWA